MNQTKIEKWTIRKLVGLIRREAFHVNPKYQRGIVWKLPHMKLLIDSAMRGYGMPMLYLRPHGQGEEFEMIDGQQRINVLGGFTSKDGLVRISHNEQRAFGRLLNPCTPLDRKHFPTFLQDKPCDWGGKKYSELSDELRDYFLGREIPVTLLPFADNEARDMFIRLQGGYDLTQQEKRDAWFSDFCDKVLLIGGKPEMDKPSEKPKFAGHEFFPELMRLKPINSKGTNDRGRTRKMAAQLMMLFLCRNGESRHKFTSINSQHIDGCYREHVELSEDAGENIEQFEKVLDKLTSVFRGRITPKEKLKAHEAIHLVLFAGMLSSGAFEDGWQGDIFYAFSRFRSFMPTSYAARINNKSGESSIIAERHTIFANKMLHYMNDSIRAKDLDDSGNPPPDFEEAVFYRDEGKCCACKKLVKWEESRVRQVSSRRKVSDCPWLDVYELVCDKCP